MARGLALIKKSKGNAIIHSYLMCKNGDQNNLPGLVWSIIVLFSHEGVAADSSSNNEACSTPSSAEKQDLKDL